MTVLERIENRKAARALRRALNKGCREPRRFLADFASGMQGPQPSSRSLFLRGAHAAVYVRDPAPDGALHGRRLAAWCKERSNGVAPSWHVAGTTYWVTWSRDKCRAFYRVRREARRPDGTRYEYEAWLAIAAPDDRLLKMRLACRAGLPVSAVQEWPTFVEGAT